MRITIFVTIIVSVFASQNAWAESRVIKGCEPIAAVYLKQALKSSKDAQKISGWLAEPDFTALCSFYTTEYPEWQARYINEIKKLKKKGVCWDVDDQLSLNRNEASAREGVELKKTYCDKAVAK